MILHNHPIGVCSWSLHPKDLSDLLAQTKAAGLAHIQIGLIPPLTVLDPARIKEQAAQIKAAGIELTGGMIGFVGEDYTTIDSIKRTGGFVPDADYPARFALVEQAAKIAAALGAAHVSAHIGFVPHEGDDPARYQTMIGRIRDIADLLKTHHLGLNLETGQEPAAELAEFLERLQRPTVGVNFDPANMILYGAGDPIAAINILGPRIKHVHVKDATASANPGTDWGAEVPFGTGQVNAAAFLKALHDARYTGPLCIEREAGSQRLVDVKFAVETIRAIG